MARRRKSHVGDIASSVSGCQPILPERLPIHETGAAAASRGRDSVAFVPNTLGDIAQGSPRGRPVIAIGRRIVELSPSDADVTLRGADPIHRGPGKTSFVLVPLQIAAVSAVISR